MKIFVYKDEEQWLPFFKWFWEAHDEEGNSLTHTEDNMGHGAYPAKWIAWTSAFIHIKILKKT